MNLQYMVRTFFAFNLFATLYSLATVINNYKLEEYYDQENIALDLCNIITTV
jgi:hypothetical protein